MRASKFLQRVERPPADLGVPRLFVVTEAAARLFVERRQEVESDVGGLVIPRIRARDVLAQRTERGRAGESWLSRPKLGKSTYFAEFACSSGEQHAAVGDDL